MNPSICVRPSRMEDGKFRFNLKRLKPVAAALRVVITRGPTTGSNRLITNQTKSHKCYFKKGQGRPGEQQWNQTREETMKNLHPVNRNSLGALSTPAAAHIGLVPSHIQPGSEGILWTDRKTVTPGTC